MAVSAWYYNSDSGAINHQQQWIAYPELHMGLGWHGPFPSKDAAIAFYQQGKAANPGWKAPTGLTGNIANAAGVPTIEDTFKGLNLGGWVLRVGEILLGLVLIGVGVAKLSGTTNVISKAVKARI